MGLYYYYVEKNYDEALRWLDRARAIAPNVWKCISATALVKRRQGKVDEAIALQERGAELDPRCVDVIIRRYEALTRTTAVLADTGEAFATLAARRLCAQDSPIP